MLHPPIGQAISQQLVFILECITPPQTRDNFFGLGRRRDRAIHNALEIFLRLLVKIDHFANGFSNSAILINFPFSILIDQTRSDSMNELMRGCSFIRAAVGIGIINVTQQNVCISVKELITNLVPTARDLT